MKECVDLGLEMLHLGLEMQRERWNERVRGFGAGNTGFGAGNTGFGVGNEVGRGGERRIWAELGGERGGVEFGWRNGDLGQMALTALEHEPNPEEQRLRRPHLPHTWERGA